MLKLEHGEKNLVDAAAFVSLMADFANGVGTPIIVERLGGLRGFMGHIVLAGWNDEYGREWGLTLKNSTESISVTVHIKQ